jgi:hypothetical protein
MAYPHISPGDKFRPNAEKENAISRLLDKAQGPAFIQSAFPPEERSVSLAINVSGDVIPAGSPVELVKDPEGAATSLIETPAILVTKKKNGSSGLWGVALEELQAGALGPVQLHGVSICTEVQGEKLDFVDANEGGFFYSNSGSARVLKSNAEEKSALVFLGGAWDYGYNGMFAVKRDENGIYVSPGYTDLGEFAGGYVKEGDPTVGFVCLVASLWGNEDRFSVRCAPIPFDALYQAGHYVYWEIATIRSEVVQLHMGMIAFRERFYIS